MITFLLGMAGFFSGAFPVKLPGNKCLAHSVAGLGGTSQFGVGNDGGVVLLWCWSKSIMQAASELKLVGWWPGEQKRNLASYMVMGLGYSIKVVSCKLILSLEMCVTSCNLLTTLGVDLWGLPGLHPSWLVIPQLAWLKFMKYFKKFTRESDRLRSYQHQKNRWDDHGI